MHPAVPDRQPNDDSHGFIPLAPPFRFTKMSIQSDAGQLPLTSMRSTLQLLICLISAGLAINEHMKLRRRRGYRYAKLLHLLNNRMYAIFSLVLGISMLLGHSSETYGYIYHLSKFYESIDIFLFLLSGYVPNLHFAVHHATTAIVTMDAVINQPRYQWILCAFTNLVHHTFMYAMFGGYTVFKSILPITASVQLGVGLTMSAATAYNSEGKRGLISLALYATYIVLYIKELRDLRRPQTPSA